MWVSVGLFTLVYLYLLFYACAFILFSSFFHTLLSVSFYFQAPITLLSRVVKTYSSYVNVYAFLFLSLTGLPPFFLFFPKVYFLGMASHTFNVFLLFSISVFLFLSVLYYLQVFRVGEGELVFLYSLRALVCVRSFNSATYSRYYFISSFLWFSFFNFFSIFFGLDFFLISINLS